MGQQWEFSQLWVSASYVLSIVALALMIGLVVPAQVEAATAIEDGRDGGAFSGRIVAGAGLATLAWSAIIVLMVAKPGA